jgi:multiple antibiotic resistance protein
MNPLLNAFLLTYAALFPIINPVGNAPIILSLTRTRTERERAVLARNVAIASFLLLLGSILIGSHVLEFFGISLPVVRIGGGLVVTAFGWRMLNSGVSADGHAHAANRPDEPLDTFYPYTMPLTVGPGSMSVAITLGSQRPAYDNVPNLLLSGGGALAGILAICITIFLCYRFAERTVHRLGPSGTNVLVRLMAFILLCIGIQIIWHGWQGLMALPH